MHRHWPSHNLDEHRPVCYTKSKEVTNMTRLVAITIAGSLLFTGATAFAEEEWWLEAKIVEDAVVFDIQVRYSGCGRVKRIDRVGEDAQVTAVWDAGDTVLEPADIYVDCQCEPISGSFGTGQKSCPDQQCTKDELCACSKQCLPLQDQCAPPGAQTYRLIDADEVQLASTEITVDSLLPGCTVPDKKPFIVEDQPATESGGGCRASGTGPAGPSVLVWLLLAVPLLLLRILHSGWLRSRRNLVIAGCCVVLVLPATAGCGKSGSSTRARKKNPDIVYEPMDVVIEGTPWEQLIATQTELLDFFETGGSPGSVLSKTRRWSKKNLAGFQAACRAVRADYAQEPQKRMMYLAKAGRVWNVVKKRISTISSEWDPADRRAVGLLVNDYECR